MIKFCQQCADTGNEKYACFHGYYYQYKETIRECSACGGTFIDIDFPAGDLRYLIKVTNNIEFIKYMMELYKTDIVEYESKMMPYREQAERIYQKENEEYNRRVQSQPHCPNCNSTDIKKIRTANRMFSVSLFGLASNKIGKTYECMRCRYKW